MSPARTGRPAPWPLRPPIINNGRGRRTASRTGQSPLFGIGTSTRKNVAKLDDEKKSRQQIAKNADAETVTVDRRTRRRASTIGRIDEKIAVERGIAGGKTKGSGVVNGTARGSNDDRRRSPDRRPSRGRSPQLFSSDSESDEEHRDCRRRHRKNH